jgi:hypothetical protein
LSLVGKQFLGGTQALNLKNKSWIILIAVVLFSLALATIGCGGKAGSTATAAQAATSAPVTSASTSASSSASTSATPASTASSVSANSSALPTPPANAIVFSQIEQMPASEWGSCGTAACAGGSGTSSFWMAQNQTTPSLSGSSMEVYNSGVGANALWYMHLGANDSVSNFLWDFYVQLDSASATAAQALEYDAFQFVGGYNYMIGSQCDYAGKKWDVWDELNDKWVATTVPCTPLAPNVWHHIQWYVQRVPNTTTYHYVTLVVDGTPYTVNQTFSAKNNGWADNLGVQYQLDVNSTGAGYHEWIDQSTFTVW